VIDPITSERIEVIRGPATLLYGSNTLGGVVNVERGYVPSAALEGFHGNVSGQGETVNGGYSAGAVLTGPFRKIGWRLDLSARDAGDISTPAGDLKNTGIQTVNGSVGASYFWDWGFAGAAGSYYQSEYGIPGGFVGAHPNGVKIKLDRTHFEGKLDVHFDGGRFERTELRYGYSKYFHREFESDGSIGTQFSVLNYDLTWLTHLRPFWKLGKGEIGVWTEYRDYVPGGFIFTPDTKEWTMAAFVYEKATFGNWKWEGSLRLDHRRVDPSVEELTDIGLIRNRSYSIASGATLLAYRFGEHLESGVSVMRSARAPGIEELYSEGPHLAAYSFEVGNPDLRSEHGWGLEWFGKWRNDKTEIDLSIFRNDIRDYIFPRNSGAIHIATQLPIYQYDGQHAIMTGGEFKWHQQLPWSSSLSVTASHVRGELADSNQPLPAMPPFAGKVEIKKQVSNLTLAGLVRAADDQDRVARFEDPTDGYVVVDASLQYHLQHKNLLHTWLLSVENIGDTEYRRHLSRVRSIMPEPGRNIKLLYKVFF
jgi:iron complex outermembrane receptor protein